MKNKFPVINALSGIFKVLGWLAVVAAIITLIEGLVQYLSLPDLRSYADEKATAIGVMLVALWLFIGGLLSVAGGELLKLLLAMEEHLSETRQLLFKQSLDRLDKDKGAN